MIATTPQMTKALGISKVRLCELARKGKIPKAGKNQWDVEAVQKAVGRNLSGFQTSPARGDVPPKSIGNHKPAATHSDPQQAGVPPSPVFPARREEAPARGTLAAAELVHTQARAAKASIEVQRMEAKLIDRALAQRNLEDLATRTMTAVEAIPSKIVNSLPPEWRRDVLTAAQDAIRKIRVALADEIRSSSMAA
jgi:hypothetical protein